MANVNFEYETNDDSNWLFWVLVALAAWTAPFIFGLIDVKSISDEAEHLRRFELVTKVDGP